MQESEIWAGLSPLLMSGYNNAPDVGTPMLAESPRQHPTAVSTGTAFPAPGNHADSMSDDDAANFSDGGETRRVLLKEIQLRSRSIREIEGSWNRQCPGFKTFACPKDTRICLVQVWILGVLVFPAQRQLREQGMQNVRLEAAFWARLLAHSFLTELLL